MMSWACTFFCGVERCASFGDICQPPSSLEVPGRVRMIPNPAPKTQNLKPHRALNRIEYEVEGQLVRNLEGLSVPSALAT